jgi:hypothetical protein
MSAADTAGSKVFVSGFMRTAKLQQCDIRASKNFLIAEKSFLYKSSSVLALIASYDGENALLMFHVEQTISPQRDVEYRLRSPDSTYAALQEWSKPRTSSRVPIKVNIVDTSVPLEAQWRFKGEQGWEDCVPMEIDPSVGRFEVHILQDRAENADLEIDAMCMVGDYPSVYLVKLPFRAGGYKQGEVIEAYGQSQRVSPGQFFQRGEFIARSTRLAVIGQESQVTLRNVDQAIPRKAHFHKKAMLIVTGKKLSESELTAFLKEKEVVNA